MGTPYTLESPRQKGKKGYMFHLQTENGIGAWGFGGEREFTE